MGSNPVEILAFVDDLGQSQVRSHIEQQCLQILNNHITLAIEFKRVKITSWRGWECPICGDEIETVRDYCKSSLIRRKVERL